MSDTRGGSQQGREGGTPNALGRTVALAGMVALAWLARSGPAHAQQSSTPATPLMFDAVTVIDVEQGKLVPDQRVVVVGNRIQAVGAAGTVKAPQGAQVIDARGKFLIPGLWDMHTHADRAIDVFYPLYVANGMTGFRDAGSSTPLDTLRQIRRDILAGTRVGPPRQLLSGQSITNYPEECDRSQLVTAVQTCVGDSADAVHYVDSLKAAGADMIKPRDVHPPMYFIIAAHARKIGIPFGGHTWDNIALEATDSGAIIIDHFLPWSGDYEIDGGLRGRCWAGMETSSVEKCRPAAEKFRRNNTWIAPTLIVEQVGGGKEGAMTTTKAQAIVERLTARASEFWDGAALRGNWLRDSTSADTRRASADTLGVLRIMHAAGLPVVAGTDVYQGFMRQMPPGYTLHAELATYVAEGLTTLEALQSATINPAKMWRATDSLGTVAAGKLADLVLLDANPLDDITNTTMIRAVVANGRYFDRAALDGLVAAAQAAAKNGGEP